MITSNERSTPWLVSDVFTTFPVGLNRMKKLNGLWRHLRIRNGEHFALRLEAVFTTTVMRTEGADKQVLFDATVFTERDNSRLEELKKKL